MSVLNKIWDWCMSCSTPSASHALACQPGQVWPAAGQEPRKRRSAWVGGSLPLSQHWNLCANTTRLKVSSCGYKTDILTASDSERFRVWGFFLVLLSPSIRLLNTSVLAKFWFGEWHFPLVILPATMLDAQDEVGPCPVGFCCSALPQCFSLDKSARRYKGLWLLDLLAAAQTPSYYRHHYCLEGRCCPLIQVDDLHMNNFWYVKKHLY